MSLGRPVEFNRDKSLRKAQELFWKRGYRGTSLSDLCDGMGLSKSSMYASFGDKRTVFLTCIENYSNSLLDDFASLRNQANGPKAFIEWVLHDVANQAGAGKDRRGCLVMNAATEFAQSDRDVAAIVATTLDKMRAIIESVLEAGRLNGEIGSHVDVKKMAFFMVSTIAGMKTMVKAGAGKADLMRVANTFLELI